MHTSNRIKTEQRHLWIQCIRRYKLLLECANFIPPTSKSIFFNFSRQNISKLGLVVYFDPNFHLVLVSPTEHFFELRSFSIGLWGKSLSKTASFQKQRLSLSWDDAFNGNCKGHEIGIWSTLVIMKTLLRCQFSVKFKWAFWIRPPTLHIILLNDDSWLLGRVPFYNVPFHLLVAIKTHSVNPSIASKSNNIHFY